MMMVNSKDVVDNVGQDCIMHLVALSGRFQELKQVHEAVRVWFVWLKPKCFVCRDS